MSVSDLLNDTRRRKELGTFFRNCRLRTSPHERERGARRRRLYNGLTRDEVAYRVGISTEYYKDFEQGRVQIARATLVSLMDALQLNDHERRYAVKLATGLVIAPSPPDDDVPAAQQLVLDSLHPHPAYLVNHRMDTLAWNRAACALFGDFGMRSFEQRNIAFTLFAEPFSRLFVVDWAKHAQRAVRQLRADYGQYWDDPRFDELIERLLARSPEFATWWEQHDVGSQAEIDKAFNHPQVGRLVFKQMVYDALDVPGLRIVLYIPLDEATRGTLLELLAKD